MQISISGHHIDVTEALKDYASEKLAKLERHIDCINSIQVILTIEKPRQIAEATVRISGGDLFANAESDNMYAAIDMLTDKLDRQVIKHKEKRVGRKQGNNGHR